MSLVRVSWFLHQHLEIGHVVLSVAKVVFVPRELLKIVFKKNKKKENMFICNYSKEICIPKK